MSDRVEVEVKRDGRRFEATATLDLSATPATVWATITDYDRLSQFMPGIRACKVLERSAQGAGERLVVEQRGEFKFLMFAQSMTVLLHIDHQAPTTALAKAVRFDIGLLKARALDVFEGRYDVAALGRGAAARTHLTYTAAIVLRLPPPPGIGSMAVRQNLTAQLEAVAREAVARQRRAAA